MKSYRLNRLFNVKSNRCFDVAIDHGFFNQPGFLTGIEDIAAAVRVVVAANPDAVQLTIGQARHLQSLPGKAKPVLVLRTDVANVYGSELPATVFSTIIADKSFPFRHGPQRKAHLRWSYHPGWLACNSVSTGFFAMRSMDRQGDRCARWSLHRPAFRKTSGSCPARLADKLEE